MLQEFQVVFYALVLSKTRTLHTRASTRIQQGRARAATYFKAELLLGRAAALLPRQLARLTLSINHQPRYHLPRFDFEDRDYDITSLLFLPLNALLGSYSPCRCCRFVTCCSSVSATGQGSPPSFQTGLWLQNRVFFCLKLFSTSVTLNYVCWPFGLQLSLWL